MSDELLDKSQGHSIKRLYFCQMLPFAASAAIAEQSAVIAMVSFGILKSKTGNSAPTGKKAIQALRQRLSCTEWELLHGSGGTKIAFEDAWPRCEQFASSSIFIYRIERDALLAHRVSESRPMQEDLTHVLNEIEDPELGIGIVDLGLVYGAEWNAEGIDVEFTTTSPTCPFREALLQQINDILRHRFREAASIRVRLVLDPPWTLARLSENARKKLGWSRAAIAPPAHSWSTFAHGPWKN